MQLSLCSIHPRICLPETIARQYDYALPISRGKTVVYKATSHHHAVRPPTYSKQTGDCSQCLHPEALLMDDLFLEQKGYVYEAVER